MSKDREKESSEEEGGGKRGPNIAKAEMYKRRLFILKLLLTNGIMSVQDLYDKCVQEKFTLHSGVRLTRSDIIALSDQGIRIEGDKENQVSIAPVGLEGLWRETPIGNRLKKDKETKERIANKVIEYLKELKKEENIYELILGTGTTVYEIGKQMIIMGKGKIGIDKIHTTNLLILREEVYRDSGIKIDMIPGILNRNTAGLWGEKTKDHLEQTRGQLLIVSFNGIRFDGFSTGELHDVGEKLANLDPHKSCKFVLIPLEWDKIDKIDVAVKEDKEGGKKGIGVLNSVNGKRKYIIITDPPDRVLKDIRTGKLKSKDRAKFEDLKKWKGEGVEVIYTREVEEVEE